MSLIWNICKCSISDVVCTFFFLHIRFCCCVVVVVVVVQLIIRFNGTDLSPSYKAETTTKFKKLPYARALTSIKVICIRFQFLVHAITHWNIAWQKGKFVRRTLTRVHCTRIRWRSLISRCSVCEPFIAVYAGFFLLRWTVSTHFHMRFCVCARFHFVSYVNDEKATKNRIREREREPPQHLWISNRVEHWRVPIDDDTYTIRTIYVSSLFSFSFINSIHLYCGSNKQSHTYRHARRDRLYMCEWNVYGKVVYSASARISSQRLSMVGLKRFAAMD